MLQELGEVTALKGAFAQVATQHKLACSSCKLSTSCGSGLVEQYLSSQLFVTDIRNDIDAIVGETVMVEIENSKLTKAALLVYGIPLLALLLSAMIAQYFNWPEGKIIVVSALGLFGGFCFSHLYLKKNVHIDNYQPRLRRLSVDQSIPVRILK